MESLAFALGCAISFVIIAAFADWMRRQATPIPRQDPRYIFRFVHREDRAAYVRIMRRLTVVALRDLSRQFRKTQLLAFGRALLPVVVRFNDALERAWRGHK